MDQALTGLRGGETRCTRIEHEESGDQFVFDHIKEVSPGY
jgi:hypothetical protein